MLSIKGRPLDRKDQDSWWGLIYVATPYSKYAAGLNEAAIDACVVTGELMRHGFTCVSPIAHSHFVAEYAGLDKLDYGIWIPQNEPLLYASNCIAVAKLPGWDVSIGVKAEVNWADKNSRPVVYLDVDLDELDRRRRAAFNHI